MGIETAIVGIVSAAGLFTQYQGLRKAEEAGRAQNAAYAGQAEASRKASEASKAAEVAREQQMRLDASRSRRQAIRTAQLDRAQSVVRQSAAGAGAITGQRSSVYGGAEGQRTAALGRTNLGIYQNEQIGSDIFAANRRVYDAQAQGAAFGSAANQAGAALNQAQGLSSLGQSLVNIAPAAGRIGSSLYGQQGYPGQNQWEASVIKYI